MSLFCLSSAFGSHTRDFRFNGPSHWPLKQKLLVWISEALEDKIRTPGKISSLIVVFQSIKRRYFQLILKSIQTLMIRSILNPYKLLQYALVTCALYQENRTFFFKGKYFVDDFCLSTFPSYPWPKEKITLTTPHKATILLKVLVKGS